MPTLHNITYRTHLDRLGLALLCFLLLEAFPAHAQPRVVTTVAHPCFAGVEFVRARSQEFPSDWEIAVFCRPEDYEKAEKIWGIPANIGSFTILSAKTTYILFTLRDVDHPLKSTKSLLDHELKHIRCKCDLGEGKKGRLVEFAR